MNITNTTTEAVNNPLIGFMDALNIPAAEARGQMELVNSSQLPSKMNSYSKDNSKLLEIYEKLGIKVLGQSKGDNLFLDVVLPEGWKKRGTSHSMWNELVDDKGRVRATFFYKAAFYDRDAFINFNKRYGFSTITYLPQEEKGHYEKQLVEVLNPNYKEINEADEDGWGNIVYSRNGHYFCTQDKYIKQMEDVWVPKYKNSYVEDNNTPLYFEITDNGKLIYSTKDSPFFYKKQYQKRWHTQWWAGYEKLKEGLRTSAIEYLDKNYPGWDDIYAYWN